MENKEKLKQTREHRKKKNSKTLAAITVKVHHSNALVYEFLIDEDKILVLNRFLEIRHFLKRTLPVLSAAKVYM